MNLQALENLPKVTKELIGVLLLFGSIFIYYSNVVTRKTKSEKANGLAEVLLIVLGWLLILIAFFLTFSVIFALHIYLIIAISVLVSSIIVWALKKYTKMLLDH